MRILSVTAQKPGNTGSGVYLSELVRTLAAAGHEQAVMAGVTSEDDVCLPEKTVFYPVLFQTPELPFPVCGMSDTMPYESTRYRDMTPQMTEQYCTAFLNVLRRAVEEFRPELILCHHLYYLTALVRENCPTVRVYGFCHNTDLRQMDKHDFQKEVILSAIRRLDRVFSPTKQHARRIEEIYGVPQEKITVLGTGYNRNIFRVDAPKPGDGAVRLCFAGKISEKKGVESLLRALSLPVLGRYPLQVILCGGAGSQEEYERITALAERCPHNVEFTGRLSQQELARVYNKCDIFVLPSFSEGLPLVAAEALACGCRLVITRLPGVTEWLEENVSGAHICYVELPPLERNDDPVPGSLPCFEERLAAALRCSIEAEAGPCADVSRISWEKLCQKIISNP